jgi:pyroglutamyl-peptidase
LKALVAGFEPFGGLTINASMEAVQRLRPMLGPLTIERLILPTVFERSRAVLADAVERLDPDIILCTGEAGERPELSLERLAVNLDDASIPDNDGQQPQERESSPGAPVAYWTTLPVVLAVAALRGAGLPARASLSAGSFVCNHVFFGLMHTLQGSRVSAGFLHVPHLPEQAAITGGPSMALEHIVQGVQIVLAVTAERKLVEGN